MSQPSAMGSKAFPEALTFLLLIICIGVFCGILYAATAPSQLVVFMAGQFFTALLICVNYHVGTSQSSKAKTEILNASN